MVREMKANLESPELVGSSPQITPQPAAKVSLLHLQSLVEKTTLLRVIPLLPDGSSPRESPGIRALGIPVVAGRNRTNSQTPIGQRKLSEITLDGTEYGAPNEVTPDGSDELKQGNDRLPSPVSGSELFSPEVLLGNQKRNFGMPGDFSGNITMDLSSDDEDFFCTPPKGLGPGDIHNPPDFQLRYRKSNNGSLASDVAMSYSRDTDGHFKLAGICRSDKPLLSFEKSDYKRRSRVFSISSMQRDLSPMTQKTFKRIVELDAPTKDIHFGGQDGAMEGSEVVLRSSEVSAESAAAAKEDSSVNSDDGIPVEGEMVKQLTPEAGESGYFESDKIRMRIERDTLFICFPGNIRGDAVVIEIILEVKPLYLEGKPYVTFIFAGLPYCENGAYINFRIDDEDDWKFNTFPEISTFETEGSQENRLCGILELAGNLHPTAVNRSLIIRALRRPVVLEMLDFRMKTDVTASFTWSPVGDRITSQFEINIIFLDIKLDNDASRSMINFYLVNGPETQDDMTVDSPEGIPPQFVFGDLDFENLEVSVRRCKLLRIERPMRDARQPLRIRFNKLLGFNLKETGIPSVRVRGEAVLVEESIFIVKPRLPLEVVFSPNSTSWKEMDKSGAEVSTKFTRTGISMREASPSVFISCLNPVMSSAGEEIGLALATEDGFIDRISYEIEESESFSDRETSVVALRMSFGIYIPAGLGPMGEIVRIHVGSFGFSFATINDRLAGKGVLFEDGDELLVLNREIAKDGEDKDGRKERLLINTEWFGEQGLELSCGEMEFRLPRVMARVVGRTDFECGNRQARIVSRTQNPNSKDATSRFTKSKVIISGMDTSKNEIFLHIPCERGQDTPRARISKYSSPNSSPLITDRTLSPSLLSMSATSFHSILEEGLESVEKQRQEQSETTEHDASSDISGPSWVWSSRDIMIIILVILVLCFNIITRNSALKSLLHPTKAILGKGDGVVDGKPPNNMSPRFQPQRPRELGPEDMWWSVVGNGDSRDIGHLTIGVVKMNSPYMVATCDTTDGIADGEHPTGGEQHVYEERLAREVESGQKKADDEELQKRLAGILLEDNSLIERAQQVLGKVFSFFWSLVFGV